MAKGAYPVGYQFQWCKPSRLQDYYFNTSPEIVHGKISITQNHNVHVLLLLLFFGFLGFFCWKHVSVSFYCCKYFYVNSVTHQSIVLNYACNINHILVSSKLLCQICPLQMSCICLFMSSLTWCQKKLCFAEIHYCNGMFWLLQWC